MSQINESRRAALNVEEAALLPALPRNRAGSAALRTALRASEEIAEKRVGRMVDAASGPAEESAPLQRTYRQPGSRAALHHVLRR